MKKIKCENIKVAYKESGNGLQAVILLHGWGVGLDHKLMEPINKHLSKYFTVYNLDWPGFGESDLPDQAFSTTDYCRILALFIAKLEIENPILIGHSFGCRIALRYAADNPVFKMVLTGAAGLKGKRDLDYYLKVYSYKAGKQLRKLPGFSELGKNVKYGSSDYQAVSGVMRETFVKVVNEDVKDLLPRINCEVLLVYGDLDEDTPIWMGEYLEKHLPNAGLAVFKGDDHYAYLHQLPRFLQVIDIFLKEEEKNATID